MLHAGLDLSRRRVDVCLISDQGGAGRSFPGAVADAQKVKRLAPLACQTDEIDARVLAELSFRDLVPAIWLATPELRCERERERSRCRLHLVKHRSTQKPGPFDADRVQVPMADLLGVAGAPKLDTGPSFIETRSSSRTTIIRFPIAVAMRQAA